MHCEEPDEMTLRYSLWYQIPYKKSMESL